MRPNAAAELGVGGAKARLNALVEAAADAIPPCPGAAELRALIRVQTRTVLPQAALARRGLKCRPQPRRPSAAPLAFGELAQALRDRLIVANPRFQRWAAAFR